MSEWMTHASIRAAVVSVAAAMVVVPLSGMAAANLVGASQAEPEPLSLGASADYLRLHGANPPVVVASAAADWEFEVPAIRVERNASRVPSRPVANNPAPPSVAGNKILEEAAKYVGYAYKYGGSSPKTGFDCSGFVSYVYGKFGIKLPRTSGAYYNIGTRVSAADALPGDIIVSPGHVSIYAGDGQQIDAPRPGKTIQFRAIWQSNPIYIRVS